MILRWTQCALPLIALAMAGCTASRTNSARRDVGFVAEGRAIRFLSREVPAWHRDNGCYSCHNNGDAARALYAAAQVGYRIPTSSLKDTTAWVARPGQWEHNKGDPAFSDQRLADLQFAGALSAAVNAGRITDRAPQIEAAKKLVARQDPDGSWPVEPGNSLGSPATYGPPLATSMAIRMLQSAGAAGNEAAIERAQHWLRGLHPNNVPAAAAVLLAIPAGSDGADQSQRAECLDLIRRSQNPNGGWGPYAGSPSEPFDTGIALLALNETRAQPGIGSMIDHGRAFLIAEQLPDGGWLPTTRPPGGESYAQRISTTGWATLALIATREAEYEK